MPVPDQVPAQTTGIFDRDDGSPLTTGSSTGIQNALESVDSGWNLSRILLRGRNDNLKEFLTSNEFINLDFSYGDWITRS